MTDTKELEFTLTYNEEGEFIEVLDHENQDGFGIPMKDVTLMELQENELHIKFDKPNSDETTELEYDIDKDLAYKLIDKWLDWQAQNGYSIDLIFDDREENINVQVNGVLTSLFYLEDIESMSNDGSDYLNIDILEVAVDDETSYDVFKRSFPMKQEDALDMIRKYNEWNSDKEWNSDDDNPETVRIDVRCPNDDDNRKRIAERMKELNNINFEHENEIDDLRSTSATHREGIKQNNKLLKELCDEYDQPFVNRAKECLVERDYKKSEIRYVDPDTGDIVESRKMSLVDKQTSLDLDQPKQAVTETDNQKELWWDYAINYENSDGTNFMKKGMTDKRFEKIKTAMFNDPKYKSLIVKFDESAPDEMEDCIKEFVDIAYGIMIDTGLIK